MVKTTVVLSRNPSLVFCRRNYKPVVQINLSPRCEHAVGPCVRNASYVQSYVAFEGLSDPEVLELAAAEDPPILLLPLYTVGLPASLLPE